MCFDAIHLLLPKFLFLLDPSSNVLLPISCPFPFLTFNNLLSSIRIYAYVCLVTHWHMVDLLGSTPLKKIDSPSLSNCQLLIDS